MVIKRTHTRICAFANIAEFFLCIPMMQERNSLGAMRLWDAYRSRIVLHSPEPILVDQHLEVAAGGEN